jgi:hypothetical protein
MKHANVHHIVLIPLLVLSGMLLLSCQKESSNPTSMSGAGMPAAAVNNMMVAVPDAGSENGSGGDMPAYYDAKLFTINFNELPSNAEAALIAQNHSINTIYMSDPGLPGNQPFISVLDAIQGDGFNPLWRETQISFNAGITPHQFFSDNDIINAASGSNPEITLTVTNEVYRCAVVGPKK